MFAVCTTHDRYTLSVTMRPNKSQNYRNTATVHTSAKGRRRNDVIDAMAMPASACPPLRRRAVQSVDTIFRISQ